MVPRLRGLRRTMARLASRAGSGNRGGRFRKKPHAVTEEDQSGHVETVAWRGPSAINGRVEQNLGAGSWQRASARHDRQHGCECGTRTVAREDQLVGVEIERCTMRRRPADHRRAVIETGGTDTRLFEREVLHANHALLDPPVPKLFGVGVQHLRVWAMRCRRKPLKDLVFVHIPVALANCDAGKRPPALPGWTKARPGIRVRL
ncbi:hypothetical protein SAMN05443432_108173 [Roseovarius litoreus]|uniref:Uncharacterized protein n=1 Tax=Roseovarius litoreus TaxID=1155722 RepID=A0A1M7JG99_9RHOB|nr:hypothetical protein SAMN05443432_108173 [Roseovarius litoreus]